MIGWCIICRREWWHYKDSIGYLINAKLTLLNIVYRKHQCKIGSNHFWRCRHIWDCMVYRNKFKDSSPICILYILC